MTVQEQELNDNRFIDKLLDNDEETSVEETTTAVIME